MVDTNFTLVSGTYVDEQHLLSELDFFMVNTIGGWTQVKVVTDTALDKNIAYYTDGSNPGEYDRLWLRLRANNNILYSSVMSYFDADTDTASDEVGAGVDNTEIPTTSSSGIYWFAANRDAVHVLVEGASNSVPLHGGFGHFNTYYTPAEDPKPFFVFGQTFLAQVFSSSVRMAAYAPHSWGTAYAPSVSGIGASYLAAHPTHVKYGTPNPRHGGPKLIEPVFYSSVTFGKWEVRGEVPGLYMCGGTGLTPGGLINIDSRLAPTVSGSYLINKHTDAIAWAIGPVTVSGGA